MSSYISGMLSGMGIIAAIKRGDIVINPFNENQLNPNSYNITLGDELVYYTDEVLDAKKENPTKIIKISEEGFILQPGELYLVKIREYTETHGYIPQLSGRSSVGRVGLSVHICAGFGSVGYKGCWVLGLNCLKPIKVYPGMQIGQIYFYTIEGEINKRYCGRYQNKGDDIFKNKSYQDFIK